MSGTAVQGRTSDLFSPVGLEKFLESAAQKVFENKLETLAPPTNALTLQSKNQKIQTTPCGPITYNYQPKGLLLHKHKEIIKHQPTANSFGSRPNSRRGAKGAALPRIERSGVRWADGCTLIGDSGGGSVKRRRQSQWRKYIKRRIKKRIAQERKPR